MNSMNWCHVTAGWLIFVGGSAAAEHPIVATDAPSELPAGALVRWKGTELDEFFLLDVSRCGRWSAVSSRRGAVVRDEVERTSTVLEPNWPYPGLSFAPRDGWLTVFGPEFTIRKSEQGKWNTVVRNPGPFGGRWVNGRIARSPDGSRLAVISFDPHFSVLRADTGEIDWIPPGNFHNGHHAAFSADGAYLALDSAETPSVWRWPSKERVDSPAVQSGDRHKGIAFAGFDTLVWTSRDRPEMYERGLPDGTRGSRVLASLAWAMTASPDGGLLAYGEKTGILVRDLATDADLVRVPAEGRIVRALALSGGGKRLLCGRTEFATLWDLPEIVRRSLGEAERRRIANLDDDGLWKSLAGPTPQESFLAFWKLAEREGKVVDFLRKRFDFERGTADELRERIMELDSDDPSLRDRAETRLNTAVWHDVPFFETARREAESPEIAARLATILGRLQPQAMGGIPHPELRRAVRAVRLLEVVRTPEARRLVESLTASGALPVRDAARAVLIRWPVAPAEKP